MKANDTYFIVRIDKKAQTEKRTFATQLDIGFLGFAHKAGSKPSAHGGVSIHSIASGGPMSDFNIGDTILRADDLPFSDYEKLIAYVQSKKPGTQVSLTYVSKLIQHIAGIAPATSVKHVTLGAKKILLPFKDANPMEYNLQYGVITAIGSQAAHLFPQSNIGDVLFFSHQVEYKPREDGDLLYHDFHLLSTDENGDEYRKVNVEHEVYGLLKVGESNPAKKIIPYRTYVWCHLNTEDSEMQMVDGLYLHKKWEESTADMAMQLHKLQSEIREKATSSVLHQKTTEDNYRQQEEINKSLRRIQEERKIISRKMRQKRLADATVLFYNTDSFDVLGECMAAGDKIVCDRACFYPLEILGIRYMLAPVLAIEALHRTYTIHQK